MNGWIRRIGGWPRRPAAGLEPRSAQVRLPRVSTEFLVLQVDGLAFRAAHVRRRDRLLESLALQRGELEQCLGFLLSCRVSGAGARRRVVLVTPEAELAIPDARLVARMSTEDRERWSRELEAWGLELVAVYPLAGSPLGVLDGGGETALCVQIERDLIAVMDLVRGRCAQLECFPRVEPTCRRVQELVGEGCPEVLLCGGGADLSELGYELARGGSTWVRILRPDSRAFSDPGDAAIVGAARHACGLVPADRMAFVMPLGGPG
jgi:hypothetical protein